MTQSSPIRHAALIAVLATAIASSAAFAQSATDLSSQTAQPTMTTADAATDKADMRADDARERAARSDTSANSIKTLEDKQAQAKSREKGEPIEEEEEGTR